MNQWCDSLKMQMGKTIDKPQAKLIQWKWRKQKRMEKYIYRVY